MRVSRANRVMALVFVSFLMTHGANASAQGKKSPSPIANPQDQVDLARFVQMPAVQRELSLTHAQITELAGIEGEFKSRMRELIRRSQTLEGEERQAALEEVPRELQLSRKLCANVFTPDQLDRLKQLALQLVSRGSGNGFGLLGRGMSGELELTDEQAKVIREKSAAIQEQLKTRELEMKAELEALRIKLQADLFDSLNPGQRAKLKSLFGELISLED